MFVKRGLFTADLLPSSPHSCDKHRAAENSPQLPVARLVIDRQVSRVIGVPVGDFTSTNVGLNQYAVEFSVAGNEYCHLR